MKLENQNILIISNEPWGHIWFSKHNYANELSKNNKVFFLNPAKPFRLTNIFSTIAEKEIQPNLFVIEYANVLPVSLLNFWKINDHIVLKRLKNHFVKKKVDSLLFWTFDPIRLAFPDILLPKKIILHAVDDYLFTNPSEEILAKKADYIFCVSETITNSYKKYNSNSYTIPHAIPDNEFLPHKPNPTKKLTGIFAGTLDLRIDYDYLNYIIQNFPDIQFKFIGKINIKNEFTKKLRSASFTNTVFEGEKPFEEVKYHIRDSDFCILFKDNQISGNSISSHKMLQYLAQGKPVFCTELTQHKEIENLLYMTNDKFRLEKLFRTFVDLGEHENLRTKRVEYAKRHSFSNTLKKIDQILK